VTVTDKQQTFSKEEVNCRDINL